MFNPINYNGGYSIHSVFVMSSYALHCYCKLQTDIPVEQTISWYVADLQTGLSIMRSLYTAINLQYSCWKILSNGNGFRKLV